MMAVIYALGIMLLGFCDVSPTAMVASVGIAVIGMLQRILNEIQAEGGE